MYFYPNKVATYLIILLPIFLITGPFLSDLSVVLIDLIFLYYLFKGREFKFIKSSLFQVLLLFNIYIILRSLFAEDIFLSLKSSFTYIRFTFLIFAINFFLIKNENLIFNFSKVFLATIGILFLDATFQFIFGYNFLGFENSNPDKLNGLFGDEGVLGSYLIRLMPFLLACYLLVSKNKFIFLAIFILISILIFLSGSRSSLALLILFVVIFTSIFIDYRKQILIFFTIFSFLIGSVLVLESLKNNNPKQIADSALNGNVTSKLSYRIYYNLVDPFKTIFVNPKNILIQGSDNKIVIFTEVYESHYRTAYKMFEKNKIFGVGNKMFRRLCDKKEYYVNKFSCSTHPHNIYIQILAENGLVGILFILTIFIYLSYILFKEFFLRNFKKINGFDDKIILIIIGIFLNLWPIVPSGNFYNNWLSIIIYLPIGFLIYFRKKLNE